MHVCIPITDRELKAKVCVRSLPARSITPPQPSGLACAWSGGHPWTQGNLGSKARRGREELGDDAMNITLPRQSGSGQVQNGVKSTDPC